MAKMDARTTVFPLTGESHNTGGDPGPIEVEAEQAR